jgi:hypothetical protein
MRTPYVAAAVLGFALAGCASGAGPGSTNPPLGGASSSLRSPLMALPTPRPSVLYYADNTDTAYSISQDASGPTVPARKFWPTGGNEFISSMATLADGRLAIVEDQVVGSIRKCRIVIQPANGNGSAWVANWFCEPNTYTIPHAVGRNTLGGVDVLYDDLTLQVERIRRFSANGTVASTLDVGVGSQVLGTNTDSNGYDYIVGHTGSALEVIKYDATATNAANPLADFTVALGNNAWGAAVAPDQTLYLIQDEFPNQMIVAIAGNAIVRTIGPFPLWHVSAIAVDELGKLYVALNSGATTNPPASNIRVYAPDANGHPLPLKIITPQLNGAKIMSLATDN